MSPNQTWQKNLYRQVWEHGATSPSTHTKSGRRTSSLLRPVSVTEGHSSMIDDRSAGFLKLTRVGSVGWESPLLYLVNIIISLTNPVVECVCVCLNMCIHREGFFHALSCPGMCNKMLSSVFENVPAVPAVFFHIWGFSLSSLHLPTHPPTCTQSTQGYLQGYLICSTFKK